MSISLCMIVKNEENNLLNCLNSIYDLVDEIIIVDTGSTDKTKEVAYKFTDKVFDFEWIYDFAVARNLSFSHATKDWILWLDADDIFVDEDRQKFKEFKENILPNTNIDVFNFWYKYRHDSEGNCINQFHRERLLRNGLGHTWSYPVHELLTTYGNKGYTDICVTHTSNHDNGHKYIDFFDYKIQNQGYILQQRDLYYYGGELYVFGYIDKAQKILELFFNMGEHDNPHESYRSAEYLIDIYLRKGLYDKAWDAVMKYLKYGSADPKAFYKLADICINTNRKKEAILYYKIAVDFENEFPERIDTIKNYEEPIFNSCVQLSSLLYKDNYDEAKKYHLKGKQLKPTHPSIIYNNQFFE